MQKKVLARVQSASDPRKEYEVRRGADGVEYCTCPASIFGQGAAKFNCKHVKAVRQTQQQLKELAESGEVFTFSPNLKVRLVAAAQFELVAA